MRPEKELLKQEIKDKIERSPSFVIMHYAGLTANMANDFRRQIGKMGGDIEVVRKRVLLKAAEDAGIELDLSTLTGHIGLVFLGQDPIETTKMVFKFSQEREKAIQVLGGRFDGQLYAAADVEKLSTLPSKNEMRAQFLSTLEAPMAQTLAVVEALLASVAYCLDNKAKQSEESAASES
ncbi:50S ribosomal protein L10 [Candidatus Protochlamydia phocaeensis]|uniref:50S ribosomal protein L10 n=1 Tax=Candidatus Protochlamydia phocaeensis TaxID=1414722 RepID=UPI000839071B|nr:50S ribosomal protein L10 [Candidatus Protochlamydia phocaeensis]